MRKIVLLLLLFVPLVNYSQPFWYQVHKPDALLPSAVAVDNYGDLYVTSYVDGNLGGVYHSNNDGQTWQFLGPNYHNLRAIDISDNNRIVVGGVAGIRIWDPIAGTWQPGVNSFNIYCINSISDSIYLAGAHNCIYRSNDGGSSWIRVHSNADSAQYVENFTSISHSPFDNSIYVTTATLYGGCARVYRSLDLGLSFQLVQSWNATMPCAWLESSAIDSSGKLLVGGTGLYRYTPEYDSWEKLGLNNTPAAILITPEGKFYFGCDFIGGSPAGAYVSEDNCQTFTEINGGLASKFVRDLAIDQHGRLLAVAGRYLQRSYDTVTTQVNKIIQNDLTVYPNPFNDCVNLLLDETEMTGNKVIRIIDSFGNIVHQNKVTSNPYQWCPNNVSKGLYYVLLINGLEVSTTAIVYN